MNSETISNIFLSVARLAYVPPSSGKILVSCDDLEEEVFHIMNKKFLEESNGRTRMLLEERYPFVKVDGRWFLSIPKLYLYLFAARGVIAKSEHPTMVTLYQAIQRASNYFDSYQKLEASLTPRGHVNYDEYQEMQAMMYKNYCMEQTSLFAELVCH